MHLLPYAASASTERPGRPVTDLPVAPGWPHADTAIGLGFADHGGWTWLIVDDEGRVAGECGVKGAPGADGVVEIGYGLAGPSRGRGLGGRAVSALLTELRGRPGVRVVEARVSVDNLASRRLLERLRFDLTDVEAAEVVYRRLV
jgi:RimJ/RimL family protein N-acetyltransferase